MNEISDVCIIGTGSSGMMAAIQASQRGLNIIVLEKKPRPGIKFQLVIRVGAILQITNSASIKKIVDLFYKGKFLLVFLYIFK